MTDHIIIYEPVGCRGECHDPESLLACARRSGIMDVLAQLYQSGILDKGGRMTADHPRINVNGKQREFVLVSKEEGKGNPAITITRKYIRELQLASAPHFKRTFVQASYLGKYRIVNGKRKDI